MSIKLTSQVWEREVSGTRQTVLLILADHANDDGLCWPSIPLIAWKIGVNERTITRTVAALERDGILEVSRIMGVGNRYRLHIDRLPAKRPFDRKNPRHSYVTPDKVSPLTQLCHPTPDTSVRGTPDIAVSPEPPIEPSKNHHLVRSVPRTTKSTSSAPAPGFDAFYAAYPRKQAKAAAQKAWNKLRPDDDLQATMLRALRIQAASPQWQKDGGQFIPLPATWLNGRRWEDAARVDTTKTKDPLAPATNQRIIA